MTRALLLTLPVALAIVLAGARAHAAGFDVATGTVDVSDAAFAIDFESDASLEDHDAQAFTQARDGTLTAVEEDELRAHRRPGGIEGADALVMDGVMNMLALSLDAADLAGRRVELVLWQKPNGTRVGARIDWLAPPSAAPLVPMLGSLRLFATGRVTNDGWEEWSTGPFDWTWAGALEPTMLVLFDAQLRTREGGTSLDREASVHIDAIHARDLGAAAVPASTCSLESEQERCGSQGLCHLGRCVDAAPWYGANPFPDPSWRADYIDRRVLEHDLFLGGRVPQARVDDERALLADARTADSAGDYWGLLQQSTPLLEDGHANPPTMFERPLSNAGVCLHEGEADLLPSAPVAPLVFSTTGDSPIAAALQPGDVLVAIDGVSVEQWVAQAPRLLRAGGDLDLASVLLAPFILPAAIDAGAVLVFARCAGPVPCAEGDEERITVDLSALGDDVLAGEDVSALATGAACDWRFLRPVPGTPEELFAYGFAGVQDDAEGIRSLMINGVPDTFSAPAWFDVVEAALGGEAPALVLFDQRYGPGGTLEAVDWIGGFLLEEEALFGALLAPSFDDGDDAETWAALRACAQAADFAYSGPCGSSLWWEIGTLLPVTRGNSASTKLAVLNTVDASSNDFLSRLIAEREQGQTRIFGPTDTAGAFGAVVPLPAYMHEASGGSFQLQDTVFLQTEDDDNLDFTTSFGVPPDQVTRQKQSDALVGRDTLIEAARAWLLSP